MSAEFGASDIPFAKIDDIASKEKYSCVGGPFGSSLSRKHYVDEEVIPVIRGTNLNGDQFIDDGFVFVSEEKGDELHRNLAYPGDIVFTQRGTLGQVAIIPQNVKFERYVVSQSQMKLTVNEKVADPYYVYSYFRSPEAKRVIDNNAIIGGVPHINLGILKAIEIPLPSLNVQKEIAGIIKNLDNKIELNRQTNQTLEKIAQAIFKSWFIDFEPTRAKIAAKKRWQALHQSVESSSPTCYTEQLDRPNQNSSSLDDAMTQAAMAAISGKTEEQLKELDDAQGSANVAGGRKPGATEAALQQLETTAALFPDALVESELGEIPEGWEYSEIGNEVTVVGGGTPSTKNADFWEGGNIHWTSPRDMSSLTDKILLDTNRKITEAGLGKISSGLLPINTVLMSSRAPVGYLAISKIPVAINQGYIAMKCESVLTPEYVVQWAESVMDDIKQRATGTTFAEISKKNFKIIPVVVPVDGVINEYTKIVSGLYSKITEGIRETKYLTESRNTLLPKLLSGEVSINNEIDVSEAVA